MPELPEIETIRRSLTSFVGKEVKKVVLSSVAPVRNTTPAAIRAGLAHRTITAIRRWGKYLLLDTDHKVTLVIHLGMSGQLRGEREGEFLGGSTLHRHLAVTFTDASHLSLYDPRRFGTISLSFRGDGSDHPSLARLGPDYLDPALDAETFLIRCRRHPDLNLKSLLLHQGVAAGLGNIYACEVLYRAGLHPKRPVRKTKDPELACLLRGARRLLQVAIRHGGTTIRDYRDGQGNQGRMGKFLQVYGREGQATLDGRGKVVRITQQGRSTWFCPTLQK